MTMFILLYTFASLVQTWMFTFVPYVFLFVLCSTAHPTVPFLVCYCLVTKSCLTLCNSMEGLLPFLVQFRSAQLLSCVRLFATPWTAAHQASLFIINSQNGLKLKSIKSVMPSNHLILCRPLLLLPPIPPSIRVFSNESVPPSGGQSIRVSSSSSVIPINIQDWFPLGLTGWISLQFKGLSRVFSSTTVQKCQFFETQLPLWSNAHIHTWLLEKTITLTLQTFVSKTMSLLFNMLSSFVIAFLPRGKHLSISWL